MDIKNLVIPSDYNGDEPIVLLEGTAPTPLKPYNYQGFQYEALDVKSFCRLVKEKGILDYAVVFGNKDGFHSILDDTVIHRSQDTVTMPYTYSVQMEEWRPVLESGGAVFKLKELIDYIKRSDNQTIENFDTLLDSIKNFKYVSNITGDFTFDNRNNYTFCVKVKDAEGTVRIPQVFLANIEIYKNSDWFQWMEIEIEIEQPKQAGEQPLFQLRCPKFHRYLQEAQENLFDQMTQELNGWLIVQGNPTKATKA
ncbi:MAG: hypothetical protein RRY12_01405 [Cloacibacillus sp.]